MNPYGTRNPWSAASMILLASALVLGSTIVSCASGPRLRHKHEFSLSPGQEHHAGLKTALLLPIDQTNEKPIKGLDVANDRITRLVVAHLESKGLRVERADPRSFRRATDAARSSVRSERSSGASSSVSTQIEFADLVPRILADLGKSPDLVVSADLVMRDAIYQGTRTLVWDGVRRREKLTGWDMSGGLSAASLRVLVYLADGTRTYSGFGGLEPVFRFDTVAKRYALREDLFEDERNLSEGVCIAFYPYFGMDEFCTR